MALVSLHSTYGVTSYMWHDARSVNIFVNSNAFEFEIDTFLQL